MILKYLIQKEFLQMRRNAFLPRLVVVFPIVMMCVIPWVMNQEVKNVVVDVVDNDRSTQSRQLVHRIEASGYFTLYAQRPSYQTALEDMERGRTDLLLVIPQDYGKQLMQGHAPQLLISANAINGTKGAIGSSYLTSLVAQSRQPAAVPSVSMLTLYNRHQDYKVFMIPALFAILMMLMCGFLPALNIVGEKEVGTIEQMNVTPVSKWVFIAAKLIPYWLVALFLVTVCLLLSWVVYGITCQGSVLLVYVLSMLLALFFSSLGLIISNYSDTMQQAIFVMWFFVVCLMLLSGLFTPTRSMPSWAYLTTYVNPVHYFIDAIRTVFIRGGDWPAVSRQVLVLACQSAVMAVWAVWSYRKNG